MPWREGTAKGGKQSAEGRARDAWDAVGAQRPHVLAERSVLPLGWEGVEGARRLGHVCWRVQRAALYPGGTGLLGQSVRPSLGHFFLGR